jgi:hypothetical protein
MDDTVAFPTMATPRAAGISRHDKYHATLKKVASYARVLEKGNDKTRYGDIRIASFHYFRQLPAELRLRIYRYVFKKKENYTIPGRSLDVIEMRMATVDFGRKYSIPHIAFAIPEAMTEWIQHMIFVLHYFSEQMAKDLESLLPLHYGLESVRKLSIPSFMYRPRNHMHAQAKLTPQQNYLDLAKKCPALRVLELSAWNGFRIPLDTWPESWEPITSDFQPDDIVKVAAYYDFDDLSHCEVLEQLVFIMDHGPLRCSPASNRTVVEWLQEEFKRRNNQDVKIHIDFIYCD